MALAFLDRDRSIAPAGYSRWLVPPAALAIHLSIGQVYAFSVFKNPLLALHGADGSVWNLKEVGYIFSIAIAFLGISAALFGAWLEKAGPRRAMFYAALCFGSGFIIASFGASTHNLALIYVGYGVIGGMGLGLGYISRGLHADQMVSGSSRPRNWSCHHGFWRRRYDRRGHSPTT